MSSWKVRSIIIKLKHIVIGFWYKLTGQNEAMRNSRIKICNKCSDKDGAWCGICGCLLDAKTRVYKEHCPNDLW